jgi:dipeptidyl aminopeptidase/acylaminoacyl peptidase
MLTSAVVALAFSATGPRPFTVADPVARSRVGARDLSRDGAPFAFTDGLGDAAIALGTVDGERMYAAGASHGGGLVPTLVSASELRDRSTLDHGRAAFTGPQRPGVPSTFLAFADEGNWVPTPKNARVFYDVVLGWLDEHIGPAANVSAKAR